MDLAEFKKYISENKLQAPADFLDQVQQKIENRERFKNFFKKIFTPVNLKLPFELAGAVVVLLVVSNIYQHYQPQAQLEMAMVPPAQNIEKKSAEPADKAKEQETIVLAKTEIQGEAKDAKYAASFGASRLADISSKPVIAGAPLVIILKTTAPAAALADITRAAEFVKGSVITINYQPETRLPARVIAELPGSKYPDFYQILAKTYLLNPPPADQNTAGMIRVSISIQPK